MSLSFVLHVPKFAINLLSISRITRDLNCLSFFFPSYCVFQDIATKKTIGLGHANDGLYILDSNPQVATLAIKRDVSSTSDELLLWQHRLGHLFNIIR